MAVVSKLRASRFGSAAVVLVLALAMSIVFGVGIARAYDPRLDDADALLEKAGIVLPLATTGGTVSPQNQKAFDRAIARAVADIAAARQEIAKARSAADGS